MIKKNQMRQPRVLGWVVLYQGKCNDFLNIYPLHLDIAPTLGYNIY
jgi:hypothetical protein